MPKSAREYKELRSRTTRKFRGEDPDGPPGGAFTDDPGQLEKALNISPEAEGLRETTVAKGDGDVVPDEPFEHSSPGEAESITKELQEEGNVNPKRRKKNDPMDIHQQTGEVPGGTVHEGPSTPSGMEGYSGGGGGGGAPAGGGVVACKSEDPRRSTGCGEEKDTRESDGCAGKEKEDERASMGCGPKSSKEEKTMATKKNTIPEVTLAEVEIVHEDDDKAFAERLRKAFESMDYVEKAPAGDDEAMALEMGDFPEEPQELSPSEEGVEFGEEMSGEELPPAPEGGSGPCPEPCVPEAVEVNPEEVVEIDEPSAEGAPEELPASEEGVEFGEEMSGEELPPVPEGGSEPPKMASTEEKEEEEEEEEEEEDEKEKKEASTTVYETLGNIEALADVRADRVTLVRANADTDDPHYLVLVDGDPIAKVALSYQPESLKRDHSELFTGEDYPKFVLEGINEFGLAEALQHVHARFYAATAASGAVAAEMKQAALQDMEADHRQRLAEMKDGLINTAEIVLQGSLKNYILENPLKDSLVSLMQTAGVDEHAAVNIVEDAWQTSAGNYFTSILKKAEEWLGASPEVLEHHINEIQGMNYRRPEVYASDEIAPAPVAHESVPANVPVQTYASAQSAPRAQAGDWAAEGRKLNLHGRLAKASLANYSYRGRK